MVETTIRVKAFMDSLMHEGFSEVLQDGVLNALGEWSQDTTLEFDLVIKNVEKVPYSEDFTRTAILEINEDVPDEQEY